MGKRYVSKVLLFDEQDLMSEEPEDFRHFTDQAYSTLNSVAVGEEMQFPALLGVCSERYNRSWLWNIDIERGWVSQNKNWSQTVRSIALWLGNVNRCYLDDLLVTNDLLCFMSRVSGQIANKLEYGNDCSAILMARSLENLPASGLPCFRPKSELCAGGNDCAHDMRAENLGPGRRVIVEVAFELDEMW